MFGNDTLNISHELDGSFRFAYYCNNLDMDPTGKINLHPFHANGLSQSGLEGDLMRQSSKNLLSLTSLGDRIRLFPIFS